MDEMINEADLFLQNLRNRAEEILTANIDSEINYIFTNDEYYLTERTKLIPTQAKKQPGKRDDSAPLMDAQGGSDSRPLTASKDTKDEREKLKKEAEKMFVKELRLRVDEYYRIVVRTLRVVLALFSKLCLKISDSSWSVNPKKKCSTPFTTSC
jgi:hypothetical protein